MKPRDMVKFFSGSPVKRTAEFGLLGPWAAATAVGHRDRSGWQLKWFIEVDGRLTETTLVLPRWADLLKLLTLGPVDAARHVGRARAAAIDVLGFDVYGLDGGA